MRGQWLSIEVLFEPAVVERPQHPRADVLTAESAEDLKFVFTVDKVINLRSVDAQQKFPMAWLAYMSALKEPEQTTYGGGRRGAGLDSPSRFEGSGTDCGGPTT